jgi:hypothetical protein
VVELVGVYPPGRRLHQKGRVVVLVLEERVKRYANRLAFGLDLLVANVEHGLLQIWGHGELSTVNPTLLDISEA